MTLVGIACKNGEFDKELEEKANKWRNKKPNQPKDRVTDKQKKDLRDRPP